MSATLDRVRACIAAGRVVSSTHGLGRIDKYGLLFEDLLSSVDVARLVEDYPDAVRGPTVLALHRLQDGSPVHAVWAFGADHDNVAVLVTAYVPDPTRWSADFLTRRRR